MGLTERGEQPQPTTTGSRRRRGGGRRAAASPLLEDRVGDDGVEDQNYDDEAEEDDTNRVSNRKRKGGHQPSRWSSSSPRHDLTTNAGGSDGSGSGLAGVAEWIRCFVTLAKRGENEALASWLRRCYWGLRERAADDRTLRNLATSFSVTLLLVVLSHRHRRHGHRQQRRERDENSYYRTAADAPLSLLYQSAERGRVHAARLGGGIQAGRDGSSIVYYRLKRDDDGAASAAMAVGGWKKSIIPSSVARELIETLSRRCNDVSAIPESISSRLVTPVLMSAIPFVYLLLLYRVLKETASGLSSGDKGEESLRMLDHQSSRVTFADVAGMPHVVTEIAEVVRYLADPHSYRAVGARPPRAILLHGPPGSGKTLLAQAVAGQANVPFFACSASEFVEVYVGRGAARVRSLFSQARQAAVRSARGGGGSSDKQTPEDPTAHTTWSSLLLQSVLPWIPSLLPMTIVQSTSSSSSSSSCSAPNGSLGSHHHDQPAASILFIDELDALGKSRMASGSNDEREQTLNQLLTELDGFERTTWEGEGEERCTVIVIAATNRVDVLDPAILRRFDRQIHVGYPATPRDRKEILLVHAKRVSCGVDVDWDRVASDARTLGCSGADLANLVNEAALLAVREGSPVIQQEQLDHAARRIQQMKWRQDHAGSSFLHLNNTGIR